MHDCMEAFLLEDLGWVAMYASVPAPCTQPRARNSLTKRCVTPVPISGLPIRVLNHRAHPPVKICRVAVYFWYRALALANAVAAVSPGLMMNDPTPGGSCCIIG